MIENKKMTFDEIISNEIYKSCEFTYGIYNIKISDVQFENCNFQGQEFSNSEWLDCTFKNMIFSNYDFSESIFYRCKFEQSQLLGTIFSDNHWKDCEVIDSQCEFINYSGATLENVIIKQTKLKEAYFQEVIIKKGLKFNTCELTGADFSETKLANIDFSKSIFEELIFSPQLIKGAIISPYQATQFLELLGFEIKY